MVTGEFGNAGIRHLRVRGGAGLPRGLLGTAARRALEDTAHGARRSRSVPCRHPVARLAARFQPGAAPFR
jgi:hypothetical protein